MRKVLVIGLDGGTFDVLMPLVEKGHLPALKRLMQGGAWGRLRTVIPPGTGPAWSSIITGLDPSNHGIADLIVRAEASYDLAFLNASSLRAPTVWDIVGGLGGEVLVLNVPMTYPPQQVNGFMVTGLLTPSGSSECTYPPEFLQVIRAIEPSYRIVPDEAYVPGRTENFLGEMTELVRGKAHVLTELLKKVEWKFAMQVFSETDFLQHALWHIMDRGHPRHKAKDRERYGQKIVEFYKSIDGLIADAAEAVGEDVPIVIISDHGAGPLHEFIHANNLLLKKGVMKVKRSPSSWIKYLLFRAGLTPLNVYRLGAAVRLGKLRMGLRWTSKGYGLLRRFFFSFSDIAWESSTAYAISGGVYGGIFVNLEGREPTGAVPKERYDEVRNGLKQMLLDVRHPRTGKPLVKEVLMREQVYGGRFLGELPDLYFLPGELTQAVFGDFEFSSNKVVEPASEAISAQHRMDGIFVARGQGIRGGAEVSGINVMDTVPLILYLMKLPIPEGLDGRLPTDLFEKTEIARRPPTYFKMEGVGDFDREQRQATDDESIKQRLKGLGYIS
jgi:predicted AlkP superfamily phosphohydrolase/phosphomutase